MTILLGRSIGAGICIGTADYLSRIASVKLYQICGGKLERREFNPETDTWAITNAVGTACLRVYQAYLYVRYVGVFSPDQEMADRFWTLCAKTDKLVDSGEEDEASDTEDSSILSRIVSDVTVSTGEELLFRGGMQPILTKILSLGLPFLGKKALLGIAAPNLIATVAIGVLFGAAHYQDYTKGSLTAATSTALAGCLFGFTKERYGLLSAIVAHTTSNIFGTCVGEYAPSWIRYLQGTKGLIAEKQERIEWNTSFIEALEKGEVSFDQPFWKGKEIQSDILDDFFFIGDSIDTLSDEEKEAVAKRTLSFSDIKALVQENGYATPEAISTKLIQLYSLQNAILEKEVLELAKMLGERPQLAYGFA
jgi:hypothetical protein